MHFEAHVEIAASPEQVWAIVTDGPNIASWDSGILRIEGRLAAGERIKLVSELNPGRTFPIRVTGWEPGRRLELSGGMPLGLMRGVRTYTMTPRGEHTDFSMREVFSGPLLPLIRRSIPDLQPSFDQYARGLKARAETAAREGAR